MHRSAVPGDCLAESLGQRDVSALDLLIGPGSVDPGKVEDRVCAADGLSKTSAVDQIGSTELHRCVRRQRPDPASGVPTEETVSASEDDPATTHGRPTPLRGVRHV